MVSQGNSKVSPIEHARYAEVGEIAYHRLRVIHPNAEAFVTPAGFEPAISAVRGQRPRPLDDGALSLRSWDLRALAGATKHFFKRNHFRFIPENSDDSLVPVERFELPNPKEVIYSHPHLAALLYWRGVFSIDLTLPSDWIPKE